MESYESLAPVALVVLQHLGRVLRNSGTDTVFPDVFSKEDLFCWTDDTQLLRQALL